MVLDFMVMVALSFFVAYGYSFLFMVFVLLLWFLWLFLLCIFYGFYVGLDCNMDLALGP